MKILARAYPYTWRSWRSWRSASQSFTRDSENSYDGMCLKTGSAPSLRQLRQLLQLHHLYHTSPTTFVRARIRVSLDPNTHRQQPKEGAQPNARPDIPGTSPASVHSTPPRASRAAPPPWRRAIDWPPSNARTVSYGSTGPNTPGTRISGSSCGSKIRGRGTSGPAKARDSPSSFGSCPTWQTPWRSH